MTLSQFSYEESFNNQDPSINWSRETYFNSLGLPHSASIKNLLPESPAEAVGGERTLYVYAFDANTAPEIQGLGNDAGVNVNFFSDLDVFFDKLSSGELPMKGSWEGFITQFITEMTGTPPADPFATDAYTEFLYAFDATANTVGTVSWRGGNGGELIDTSEFDRDAEFQAAFAEFLQNFPFADDGTIAGLADGTVSTTQLFYDAWVMFHSVTAVVLSDTDSDKDQIGSYESFYKALVTDTGASTVPFEDAFREFYFKTIEERGYFHPSRSFDAWVEQIWDQFNTAKTPSTKESNFGGEVILQKNYSAPINIIFNPIDEIEIQIVGVPVDQVRFVNGSRLQLGNKFYELARNSGTNTISIYEIADDGSGNLVPNGANISQGNASSLISYLRIDNSSDVSENQLTFTINYQDSNVTEETETIELKMPELGASFINTASSVSSEHSKRVAVLDRIFRLIALMIGSLQSVAAAQANQITFLSNWQRVFTNMISQIETFSRGDGSIFGISETGTSQDDLNRDGLLSEIRADANTKQTTRRETLSAFRDTVQSTAKREQTRVQQSQDAISQQANMATAILQQLATILGSIYR